MALININRPLQIIRESAAGLLGGSVSFKSDDKDWYNSDSLSIILSKTTEAFISGELSNIPEKFKTPNLMTDHRSLMQRWYWLYKLYGVGYLYFSDNSFFLLENSDYTPTLKPKVTILNATDYMSTLQSAYYTSNGVQIDLLADGGDIIPIYDIGTTSDMKPISKVKQILNTCNLDIRTMDALIGSMDRSSMIFISPKVADDNIPQIDFGNDKEVDKERKSFKDDFTIKKGGFTWLKKAVEIQEANPDNKRLQGLETIDFAQRNMCAQIGYPHKGIAGDTKFDDAQLLFTVFYSMVIKPDADKFLGVVNKRLKSNISIDYSKQIEMYSAPQEVEKPNNIEE